jgi:hypothetical protein
MLPSLQAPPKTEMKVFCKGAIYPSIHEIKFNHS